MKKKYTMEIIQLLIKKTERMQMMKLECISAFITQLIIGIELEKLSLYFLIR